MFSKYLYKFSFVIPKEIIIFKMAMTFQRSFYSMTYGKDLILHSLLILQKCVCNACNIETYMKINKQNKKIKINNQNKALNLDKGLDIPDYF